MGVTFLGYFRRRPTPQAIINEQSLKTIINEQCLKRIQRAKPSEGLKFEVKLSKIEMAVSMEPFDRFLCFNFYLKALDVCFPTSPL